VFRNLTKVWLYAEYLLSFEDPATSAWRRDDMHLSTGKESFPLTVRTKWERRYRINLA
jgi:hypothetical protein